MDYCGSRTIGVAEDSESWQNFLTVFPETRQLRIQTSNHNDVGTYSITIIDYVGDLRLEEFLVSITISGCKLTDFTINSHPTSLGIRTFTGGSSIDYKRGYYSDIDYHFELNPPECGQSQNYDLSAQWLGYDDILREIPEDIFTFEDGVMTTQTNDRSIAEGSYYDYNFKIIITATSSEEYQDPQLEASF